MMSIGITAMVVSFAISSYGRLKARALRSEAFVGLSHLGTLIDSVKTTKGASLTCQDFTNVSSCGLTNCIPITQENPNDLSDCNADNPLGFHVDNCLTSHYTYSYFDGAGNWFACPISPAPLEGVYAVERFTGFWAFFKGADWVKQNRGVYKNCNSVSGFFSANDVWGIVFSGSQRLVHISDPEPFCF